VHPRSPSRSSSGSEAEGQVTICDAGLLEAAAARPQAMAFGADAYPDLHAKAAALVHSLARNHALVDGYKRLALGALAAFYGINGRRLTLSHNALSATTLRSGQANRVSWTVS
jgi:prophage maintenance system killer protein